MNDEQIDHYIRNLVAATRNSPAVIGYFITDEPGVQEFPALAKAVAAVKKHAPGKIAYINLYPDYATIGAPNLSQLGATSYAEYLQRFVNEVRPQVISYDNYRVQTSEDFKNPALAASYFNNMLAIRSVAMENGLPFWNIGCANRIRPYTTIPSPANLSLQAYTTLAAGARGMTWFTYYVGGYSYAAIDADGHRTATWSFLKMVNGQIKVLGPHLLRLRSTGVFFTPHAQASTLPKLPGNCVDGIESAAPVMIGEFAGPGDEAWVMLVNLSLRDSAELTVKWSRDDDKPLVVSPADGSFAPLKSNNSIWLSAGHGALIRVR
jgi:hypothetical protein